MIHPSAAELFRDVIAMNREISMCCQSMDDTLMAHTGAITHLDDNIRHTRFPNAQTDS